jgi:hypothetical protein
VSIGAEAGATVRTAVGVPAASADTSYSSLHAWAELSFHFSRNMPRDLAFSSRYRTLARRQVAHRRKR